MSHVRLLPVFSFLFFRRRGPYQGALMCQKTGGFVSRLEVKEEEEEVATSCVQGASLKTPHALKVENCFRP